MPYRQRYSMSARTQLNDQLSKLLGHMISPIHDSRMRFAAIRELWSMPDSRLMFNYVLTSNLKKQVN